MRKIHKILTYCMIGTMTYFGNASLAQAAEIPVAGIDVVFNKFYQSNENAYNDITEYITYEIASEYKDISFAQVTNYVNVRSKASEEGEILGKLYNNAAATIIEKAGEWYKVKSGAVTGYIKAEFLITGKQAHELAETIGTRVATVTADTLRVRKEASTTAPILTLVPVGEELIVKKEQDQWLKVSVDGNETGYISADYVKLQTIFEEAVSMEEERERLEEEEAARLEEERAERATRAAANNNSRSSSSSSRSSLSNSVTIKKPSSSAKSSGIRNQIVSYALQFKGNPYVWGGTSLTQGADCSGFTQSVFRDNGISIPRTSRTQAASGRRIPVDQVQPGDLIFYAKNGTINHVGIYIGDGKIISASSPRTGIRITNYNYRQPYKAVTYIN